MSKKQQQARARQDQSPKVAQGPQSPQNSQVLAGTQASSSSQHVSQSPKSADPSNSSASVKHVVKFQISYHAEFGQSLAIVGSNEKMGSWDNKKAVNMTWSEGDKWKAEITFTSKNESEAALEYKYLVKDSTGNVVRAESGKKHSFKPVGPSSSTSDFWV